MSDILPVAPRFSPAMARRLLPAPALRHLVSTLDLRHSACALLLLTSSHLAPRQLRDGGALLDNRSLEQQREEILQILSRDLEVDQPGLERVRATFVHSTVLGQGNPRISEHPMSRAQCQEQLSLVPLHPADPICKAPHMVALYNPEHEEIEDARVCIDQFEFPNVPCEYPVVHVQANEAAAICEAIGKRLCDAHEWEGACAGALATPDEDYDWGYDRPVMRALHNARRSITWAYGPERNLSLCATASWKTPECPGGGYELCGSNTFPTGSFPACVSTFGVYDLHGNVAEHMSLPLTPDELGSRGGHGATEMKGSWFVFSQIDAHPDDCHWRAPDWHPSAVQSPRSHSNYHLGFRCCKDL